MELADGRGSWRISDGPVIREYSCAFAVLCPELRNVANRSFHRAIRWQQLFPVKTDAGSIGNVVDAASIDSAIRVGPCSRLFPECTVAVRQM